MFWISTWIKCWHNLSFKGGKRHGYYVLWLLWSITFSFSFLNKARYRPGRHISPPISCLENFHTHLCVVKIQVSFENGLYGTYRSGMTFLHNSVDLTTVVISTQLSSNLEYRYVEQNYAFGQILSYMDPIKTE